MKTYRSISIAAMMLFALLCAAPTAQAAPDAADRAVQARLKSAVTINHRDTTLKDAIQTIADQAKLETAINWPALELCGIDQDTPIALRLEAVAAEQVLQITLAQASADAFDDDKAGFTIDKGLLIISTLRDLKSRTTTRVYSIKKFLNAGRGAVPPQDMVDRLTEIITINVGDVDEWLDEQSTLAELNGSLIIKTTKENHAQIDALFDMISRPIDNAKDIAVKDDRAAQAKLDKRVSLNTDNLTLDMVIEFVRDATHSNIAVNWAALELVGIDQDSLVTVNLNRVPANQLLRLVLDQVSAEAFDDDKAGFVIQDGVVHISTLRELRARTVTYIYKLGKFIGANAGDEQAVDQVVQAITARVGDPDEWLDEESTASNFYGLLVVKTTPQNHKTIIELLEKIGG